MKSNKLGFSLVEIMIAAAMLGAISMGVMSLIRNMKQGEVISETKMEELELRRLITTLLTDQQACKNTFSGINIGSTVPSIKNGAGNIVYQKDTPYGNNTLKITDMITKDTGTINSDLTRIVHFDVTVKKLKKMTGETSKSFSIQLNVAAPGATGAITGCSVDNNQIISAANLSSCASLNGNWDATTSKCTLNDYVKLVGDTMTGGLVTTKLTSPQFCTGTNCKAIGDLALANKSCTNKNEVQIGVKADGSPSCLQINCGANQYFRGVKVDGTLDCVTLPTKDCGTGSYVYNVNADGTFNCRPTPTSWDSDCGAGQVLQRITSDGTKICVPKLTAKICNAGDFVSEVKADGTVVCTTPAMSAHGSRTFIANTTFSLPSTVIGTTLVFAQCTGGGGGGGAGKPNGANGGGGGGAGATVTGIPMPISSSTTLSITIDIGGAGAPGSHFTQAPIPQPGIAGGTSSVSIGASILVSAIGGSAGIAAGSAATTGRTGGTSNFGIGGAGGIRNSSNSGNTGSPGINAGSGGGGGGAGIAIFPGGAGGGGGSGAPGSCIISW